MTYQNDIFISYRREKNAWTPWTRDIFKRALESCLQRELGNPAKVFIDEQTPIGVNYVRHLATSLSSCKVMVALLSKDYFSSDWCVHELDLMMERASNQDLIIPIVVHDGEVIPDAVRQLQYADFREFAIPVLQDAGPLHAKFWGEMLRITPRIGNAIENSPPFDSRWLPHFERRLEQVYTASMSGARIQPERFLLKSSLPPKSPPRLTL